MLSQLVQRKLCIRFDARVFVCRTESALFCQIFGSGEYALLGGTINLNPVHADKMLSSSVRSEFAGKSRLDTQEKKPQLLSGLVYAGKGWVGQPLNGISNGKQFAWFFTPHSVIARDTRMIGGSAWRLRRYDCGLRRIVGPRS